MSVKKIAKDYLLKKLWGQDSVPQGLYDLSEYFRHYGPIRFNHKVENDGCIVAVSEDFVYGSIVTHGKNDKELEANIKDAILTSFDIPSSYAAEASIAKVGENRYALA